MATENIFINPATIHFLLITEATVQILMKVNYFVFFRLCI